MQKRTPQPPHLQQSAGVPLKMYQPAANPSFPPNSLHIQGKKEEYSSPMLALCHCCLASNSELQGLVLVFFRHLLENSVKQPSGTCLQTSLKFSAHLVLICLSMELWVSLQTEFQSCWNRTTNNSVMASFNCLMFMFLIPLHFTYKVLPDFQEVKYFFCCSCGMMESSSFISMHDSYSSLVLCKQLLQGFISLFVQSSINFCSQEEN